MTEHPDTKKYFDTLKRVRLSPRSRQEMQNALSAYAAFHRVEGGVRAGEVGRSTMRVPRTHFSIRFHNFTFVRMTALILIALLVGGGTSYAAEGSLPGDVLYPVKVEINEHVKSALAFSPEAEARLQVTLANERLEEAEELAAQGALSVEHAAEVSARLKKHYAKAEEYRHEVEADGDLEAAATTHAELEGTLGAHARVLTHLNDIVSGNNGVSLISEIHTLERASGVEATSTREVTAEVEVAVSDTVLRAETLIASMEEDIADTKDELTPEMYAHVEGRMKVAKEYEVDAQASLQAKVYDAAYKNAQKAIRVVREVEIFLRSALRLKADTEIHMNGLIQIDDDSNIEVNSDEKSSARNASTTENKEQETADSTQKERTRDDESTRADVDVHTDTSVEVEDEDIDVDADASVNSRINISL